MMGIKGKYGLVESKGLAVNAGVDLILHWQQDNKIDFDAVTESYDKGMIDEAVLNEAVKRVLATQAKTMAEPKFTSLTDEDIKTFKSIMENENQSYLYTSVGVKYIDEEFSTIFLCKMASIIENQGYDACIQRSVPNMKVKGDKSANPEIKDVYEVIYAEAVAPGRPAPEVIVDYNKAAIWCGLGTQGLNGRVINPKYGPCMRYVFFITDMELEEDEVLKYELCDKCGECIKACPGNAIKDKKKEPWQCAAYYAGANMSKNPFMSPHALPEREDRLDILSGEKQLSSDDAKDVINNISYYPPIMHGYISSICGNACDRACYIHIEEKGVLNKKFNNKFRKRPEWELDVK